MGSGVGYVPLYLRQFVNRIIAFYTPAQARTCVDSLLISHPRRMKINEEDSTPLKNTLYNLIAAGYVNLYLLSFHTSARARTCVDSSLISHPRRMKINDEGNTPLENTLYNLIAAGYINWYLLSFTIVETSFQKNNGYF
jgi:hypothetical protein